MEAHEAMLMRRIAGLIYVDDRDSGAARSRVRARLGTDNSDEEGLIKVGRSHKNTSLAMA